MRPVEAARALGLSQASVSKILNGKQTPRPTTLAFFRSIVEKELVKSAQQKSDSGVQFTDPGTPGGDSSSGAKTETHQKGRRMISLQDSGTGVLKDEPDRAEKIKHYFEQLERIDPLAADKFYGDMEWFLRHSETHPKKKKEKP